MSVLHYCKLQFVMCNAGIETFKMILFNPLAEADVKICAIIHYATFNDLKRVNFGIVEMS